MMELHPTLLVVDDEEPIQRLLQRILERAGYEKILVASSSDEARQTMAESDVDLVLTDMQMPGGTGLGLLMHVHDSMPGVATLMVTGKDDAALADKALALGAYGYIIKPFRPSEVVIGVSNALRRRDLEIENVRHRHDLEEIVRTRTADLRGAIERLELSELSVRVSRTETIGRLAVAGEFRDEETGFHVERMSRYCEVLALEIGEMDLADSIREASSLHDVGKIAIPDSVLLKPGALTQEEREHMEQHAEIGHRILAGTDSPLLQLAAEIALTHHEKIDGAGYPRGLVGDQIPLHGRIAGIADVFDALMSDRVYRPAFELPKVVEMMNKDSGSHFDADLLTAFWGVLPELLAIRAEYAGDALAVN